MGVFSRNNQKKEWSVVQRSTDGMNLSKGKKEGTNQRKMELKGIKTRQKYHTLLIEQSTTIKTNEIKKRNVLHS